MVGEWTESEKACCPRFAVKAGVARAEAAGGDMRVKVVIGRRGCRGSKALRLSAV